MEKLTKEDISQEVFDLYDDYAYNKITLSWTRTIDFFKEKLK
ncbi:hypothetical protein [Flavobacterium sp. N1736]|nr:hypothetical protein [Flavobacterium sp. N1736]